VAITGQLVGGSCTVECCHASARARTECLHARDLLPTTPLRPWGAPLCYARRSCCGGLWNGVRSACYNYASHLRLSLNSPKCWKPPLPFNQSTFHASHTQWLYPNHPHPGAHGAGGCRQGAAAIPPLSQRPCMGSPRPPPPRPCVLEATGPMWGAAGDEQRRAVGAPWRLDQGGMRCCYLQPHARARSCLLLCPMIAG